MAHKITREALRKNLDFWSHLFTTDPNSIPDKDLRDSLLGDVEALKQFMDEKKE